MPYFVDEYCEATTVNAQEGFNLGSIGTDKTLSTYKSDLNFIELLQKEVAAMPQQMYPLGMGSTNHISGQVLMMTPSWYADKIKSKPEFIKDLFLKEFISYHHYLADDLQDAYLLTNEIIEKICKVEYENISMELTPDNSILFDFSLYNGNTLYIKYHYKPIDKNKATYFSIFGKDNECLYNGIGTLTDVLEDISVIAKQVC